MVTKKIEGCLYCCNEHINNLSECKVLKNNNFLDLVLPLITIKAQVIFRKQTKY